MAEPKQNRKLNLDNLKSLADRPVEERREIARMGSIKSAEVKKKKRNLRESAKVLLEMLVATDKQREVLGDDSKLLEQFENITMADLLNLRMIQEAAEGNTKAFEVIRDTAGFKPTEQMHIDANIMTEEDKALIEKLAKREGIEQ